MRTTTKQAQAANLDTIRATRARLDEERAELQAMPEARADQVARVHAEIDAAANEWAASVAHRLTDGAPTIAAGAAARLLLDHRVAMGPSGAVVSLHELSAGALAYLNRDDLKLLAREACDALPDGVTEHDRAERLAAIDVRILETWRAEEAAVRELEAAGFDGPSIDRDPEMPAEVALDFDPGTGTLDTIRHEHLERKAESLFAAVRAQSDAVLERRAELRDVERAMRAREEARLEREPAEVAARERLRGEIARAEDLRDSVSARAQRAARLRDRCREFVADVKRKAAPWPSGKRKNIADGMPASPRIGIDSGSPRLEQWGDFRPSTRVS